MCRFMGYGALTFTKSCVFPSLKTILLGVFVLKTPEVLALVNLKVSISVISFQATSVPSY